MFDLFEERGDELRVYLWRWPKPDGGSPSAGKMLLAAVLVLVPLVVVADSFKKLLDNPAKLLVYIGVMAAAAAYIASQFIYISVTRTAVNLVLARKRRRLAGLGELANIRILQQEYGGHIHYCYAAIWRKDPYKAPLRLSPLCRTMNRLSHYQRTVIPEIRARIPLASPPDKVREDMEAPIPTSFPVFRNAFRLRVYGHVAMTGLALLCPIVLIWKAGFGFDDYMSYGLLFLALPLLKYLATFAAAAAFVGTFRRDAMKNTAIRIDSGKRMVSLVSAFGFQRKDFTFDSVQGVIVRGFGEKRDVCLALDGCDVDPLVFSVKSPAELRHGIRELCAMLGEHPWDFVDLLRPVHEWEFNSAHNIYREWNVNWKTRALEARKRKQYEDENHPDAGEDETGPPGNGESIFEE